MEENAVTAVTFKSFTITLVTETPPWVMSIPAVELAVDTKVPSNLLLVPEVVNFESELVEKSKGRYIECIIEVGIIFLKKIDGFIQISIK